MNNDNATLVGMAVLATFVCFATIVVVLRFKNKELRAWALRRQQELLNQGLVVGPRTAKLLEAMAGATKSAERVASNRFGVPVKKTSKTPKKLGRKRARAVLAKIQ